uniref:Ribonuclease H-like domain-containing protein n=1 Tax=Tanacetum cinerariifolium TaxID=118510 RepID=A0A6L2M829_TANCI|nr:ribonuclease H-like domain-containing protein [Tanacetum cinerariifolium]
MHDNIMAAGSRDHPLMLATRRYPLWQSQFLRYIDTRPNEKEAIHLILTGILDEIYSTVDACQTAQKMWEAIERYKGKEIAKPFTPPSESASEEDNDPEQAQRTMNVAGAKENEWRKPKRVKDFAYHKEKMLLCKQAEKGVSLQAKQYDWLADIDEEIDEQELEAHYSNMEKIQEVPTADSGTNSEQLEQIVKLILFIVDSGCMKHMTGNLKLLCNFVEKYLGTVRFGLNLNLFLVHQFCDADLEVAFRKSTCFVRDLQGNDLLTVQVVSADQIVKTVSVKVSTVMYKLRLFVILNGDSLAPTRVIEGVVQPVAPTTAEQRLARKNELKAHAVLTKSKLVLITAAGSVSAVVPKPLVTRPRQAKTVVTKPPSPPRKNINHSPPLKIVLFLQKLLLLRLLWLMLLKETGHMIGNMSYLSDFEKLNGGYVAFGGNLKGGKISGKGKIKTGKFDFDDVYIVKELKFNLFSVSQMYDKKNIVLFTDTECLVLLPEFKLPDENQNTDDDTAIGGEKPEFKVYVSLSSSAQTKKHADKTKIEAKGKNVSAEADFTNLETTITVRPIPTTKVHKDHPVTQIIGDLSSATQTKKEPKRVHQALKDPSWIKAMQEELLQFKMQKEEVYVCQPLGFEDPDYPDKVSGSTSLPESFLRSRLHCPTKPDKDLSHTHRPSSPIIEDWVSNSEDDSEAEIPHNAPSFVQPTEQVKPPSRNRKACFVSKSLTHLIKDSNYYDKKVAQTHVRNHAQKGNHQQYARMTLLNPQRHVVPTTILTKSKLVPITAARQVTTAVSPTNVTRPRQAKTVVTKPRSPPKRNINRSPSPKASNFPPKVTAAKAPMVNVVKGVQGKWEWKPNCLILDHVSRQSSASMTLKRLDYNDSLGRSKHTSPKPSISPPRVYTAKPSTVIAARVNAANPSAVSATRVNAAKLSVVSAVRINAVKPSAVTAAQHNHTKMGNPQQALKDKGVIDSGCSKHMTGNISYLSDFEELNGGYVAFGGNPKGGKITGKGGKITGKGGKITGKGKGAKWRICLLCKRASV